MTENRRHMWAIHIAGDYDTVYRCTQCGRFLTESIDNPHTELPAGPCTKGGKIYEIVYRYDAFGNKCPVFIQDETAPLIKFILVDDYSSQSYREDLKRQNHLAGFILRALRIANI